MKFTIETVSKMTGIPAASLRNWEKRYHFPLPERTPGGHRFYSTRDIDFLKRAAQMIEQGHHLTQIAELYKQQCCCSAEEAAAMTPPVPAPTEIVDDVTYRVDLLYNALMKFDPSGIQMHYQLLNAKLSPEQLFDRVFENILRRMGSDWCRGQISVAQEHYGSSFIRLKLASFLAIEFPASQSERILAATLADERHEGGLLLVSAHLKFRGYPVYYFGMDLPVNDLVSICSDLSPDVVTLSYLKMDRLRADLPVLGQLGIPVVIGGLAIADPTQLSIFKDQAPPNVRFCEKKIGSEAAQFVELICQNCE